MANQYTVDRTCICCGTKKETIRMKVGGWEGKYLCGNCLEAGSIGNMLKHGLDAEHWLRAYFKRREIRILRNKA